MEDGGSELSPVQRGIEFVSLTVALLDVLARYSTVVVKFLRNWSQFFKGKVIDLHEFKF